MFPPRSRCWIPVSLLALSPLFPGGSAHAADPGLPPTGASPSVRVISRGGASGTYQAFPDACRLANGDLVCVFYAGYGHVSLPRTDKEAMPRRGTPLTVAEIERLRTWIATGAEWPANAAVARHWAYQPPVKAPVPADAPHPVDAFITTRLKAEGLALSPPAAPEIRT